MDTLANVKPGTRHTSGLAMDIYYNASVASEKQAALDLIDVLVANHPAMQWSDLIFTNFHIGGGVGGFSGDGKTRKPWTSGGHNNHIHIDWVDLSLTTGAKGSAAYVDNPYNWSALAQKAGWSSTLAAALSSGGAVSGTPAPSWLAGWWKVSEDGADYYYYFGSSNTVTWTDNKPVGQLAPMTNPRNSGRYLADTGKATLTWNEVGGMSTVETFRIFGASRMDGSSNRGGPLVATRV
jgi:hypothetical protein